MPAFGVIEGISPSSNPYAESEATKGEGLFGIDVGSALSNIEEAGSHPSGDYQWVRRPLRGMQLKEETFATISVKDHEGKRRAIINESYPDYSLFYTNAGNTPYGTRTSNFILQSVQEARAEKTQVVQTFDGAYIFFYGEQPRTIVFRGLLLNTADFSWRAEWWANYNQYFRGTALVRQSSILEITWDDITVKGYILDSSCTEQTEQPYNVNLGFTLFVTSYVNRKDNSFSQLFPVTSDLIEPIVAETLDQTVAGKVRSLALSNYLRDNVTYARAVAAVQSDFSGVTSSAWGNQAVDFLQKMKQFMFGRPLRVPPGAAGSELVAGLGQLQFAAGTTLGNSAVDALFGKSLPQIRQYFRESLSVRQHKSPENPAFIPRTRFLDNFDEFPRSGIVYYDGRKLNQDDVNKAMTKLLQEAKAKGRDLLIAEEEAAYFEAVSDLTFEEFGIDPRFASNLAGFGWGRSALGAFNLLGTSLLSYDVNRPRTWGDARRLGDARVGQGVRVGGF
jgi:hypothetical protein